VEKKLFALMFLLSMPVFSIHTVAYEDGSYCKVYDVSLNATVGDIDNDLMTVNFYWGNYTNGNYTFLAGYYNVPNGSNVILYLSDFWHREIIVDDISYNITWLEHSHHYEWFVTGYDGKNITLVQNWFDTCKACDVDMNRRVNYLDISELVSHYSDVVIPGSISADINEDGRVNYLDISNMMTHYSEVY